MNSVFTIVQHGETMDSLSQELFKKNPKAYRSKEEAKAIIPANNPMAGNGIWSGMGLNITPRASGYQNMNMRSSTVSLSFGNSAHSFIGIDQSIGGAVMADHRCIVAKFR